MKTEPRSLPPHKPNFVVSFLPYDPTNLTGLLLFRGPNVRSIPNCYSIPTGVLEHGESFEDSIAREMLEEIGVDHERSVDGPIRFHSIYRNIPEDGFDWVIGVWSVPVNELKRRAKNMEPDKHSRMIIEPLRAIRLRCEDDENDLAPNIGIPLQIMINDLLRP